MTKKHHSKSEMRGEESLKKCDCHCHQEFHDSAFPSFCCKAAKEKGIICEHCQPEPQSQQGIINWKNGSQWTHYYGAMFECGDYEQLLDDINDLLHQQRELTRKETLEEVVSIIHKTLGVGTMYPEITDYISRPELVEKLQSLINKQ